MATAHQQVKDSAVRLEESAGAMEVSAEQQTESADRRTALAEDRTLLASERTYAAWVRTGLAAMASGIGARTLLDAVVPLLVAQLTGAVLILFSAFCFAAGVWRELDPWARARRPPARRLSSWLLVTVNGFLILVAVAALVGIWAGGEAG